MNKFLKTHWLGLLGLAGLVFLMSSDVAFTSQADKVDAEGPYVMTRTFGTHQGDLFFSVVGKQVDQETQWIFHPPKLGSGWFDRNGMVGMWNARFPLWVLVIGTIGGIVVTSALKGKKAQKLAASAPEGPTEPEKETFSK